MGVHQIKKLLYSKGNDCQNQETTYRMREYLYQVFIKELTSRIYKEFKNANAKRTKNPIIKWANKQFSKEVQMANKYMKKYSISLAIKEMQIKETLRFHLIQVRMAIMKKTNKTNAGEDEMKLLYTVGGNIN
jgi:hypothetical protein